MHYIIIGNGIIALSTVFRLSQQMSNNDRITIIGPNTRIGSATLAAAAMQNSFAELNAHSLKSDASSYQFELSYQATREWPKFEKKLIEAAGDHLPTDCKECQITEGGCFSQGTYIINNTASDSLDDLNFSAILNALVDFNEQHELIDPNDIPNYYPEQRKRATKAIFIHNEGWLNPRLVIEKLDAIIHNDPRIVVINDYVESLVETNGLITSAITSKGHKIEGDKYLLANGASAQQVLTQSALGLNIQRIFYGIGVSLEIISPGYGLDKCIRTPNRGGACGIYATPFYLGPDKSNEHVLIGASNYLSPEPVNFGRLVSIEHLMRSAIEEINGYFYNAQLYQTNVGWRPTSQDVFPLIGETSINNLTIATATKRDGFHMSPVYSRYISDILMSQTIDNRFDVFSPERELIKEFDREAAINIVVESLMSEQYQHGYSPSNIKMNSQVKETYRTDIEQLHDKVGAVDWGIHPELINMYRRGHAVVK